MILPLNLLLLKLGKRTTNALVVPIQILEVGVSELTYVYGLVLVANTLELLLIALKVEG